MRYHNPAVHTMPEPVHIMPAKAEPSASMAATPEPLRIMSGLSESPIVMAATPETPKGIMMGDAPKSQANRAQRASNSKSSGLSTSCLGSPRCPTTFFCPFGDGGCHLVCLGCTLHVHVLAPPWPCSVLNTLGPPVLHCPSP